MHRHSSHCTRGLTDAQRLDHYVPDRPEGECWIWTGAINRGGYGVTGWRSPETGVYRQEKAHRLAYRVWVGAVPDDLPLDHVKARGCTSKACVNPAHLEPVTVQTNTLRGDGPSAANARKSVCCRGHEFDQDRVVGDKVYRNCSECNRIRQREYDIRHGRFTGEGKGRPGIPRR